MISAESVGSGVPTLQPVVNLALSKTSQKDSRWLTLEVCREFQRSKCSRSEEECRYAHPPPHVEIVNGRVTACYDSIKGKCTRTEPPCKYLHPPEHLREQLLQNGKHNLVFKNLQVQALQQAALYQTGTVPAVSAMSSPFSVNHLANAYGAVRLHGYGLPSSPTSLLLPQVTGYKSAAEAQGTNVEVQNGDGVSGIAENGGQPLCSASNSQDVSITSLSGPTLTQGFTSVAPGYGLPANLQVLYPGGVFPQTIAGGALQNPSVLSQGSYLPGGQTYLTGVPSPYLQAGQASYLQGGQASYLQGGQASYLQGGLNLSRLNTRPMLRQAVPVFTGVGAQNLNMSAVLQQQALAAMAMNQQVQLGALQDKGRKRSHDSTDVPTASGTIKRPALDPLLAGNVMKNSIYYPSSATPAATGFPGQFVSPAYMPIVSGAAVGGYNLPMSGVPTVVGSTPVPGQVVSLSMTQVNGSVYRM